MTAKPTTTATTKIRSSADSDLQISAMTGKGKSSATALIRAEAATQQTSQS